MRMRFKINGQKIGRGKCKVLRDGNEIAFGTAAPQGANGGFEDYREYLLSSHARIYPHLNALEASCSDISQVARLLVVSTSTTTFSTSSARARAAPL